MHLMCSQLQVSVHLQNLENMYTFSNEGTHTYGHGPARFVLCTFGMKYANNLIRMWKSRLYLSGSSAACCIVCIQNIAYFLRSLYDVKCFSLPVYKSILLFIFLLVQGCSRSWLFTFRGSTQPETSPNYMIYVVFHVALSEWCGEEKSQVLWPTMGSITLNRADLYWQSWAVMGSGCR